jgi:3D (Asp-Asp-Asp) domain-containing protein
MNTSACLHGVTPVAESPTTRRRGRNANRLNQKENSKTINSRYSLVVTHPTTNLPAHGLSTAERTGSPVVHVLWSIAEEEYGSTIYIGIYSTFTVNQTGHNISLRSFRFFLSLLRTFLFNSLSTSIFERHIITRHALHRTVGLRQNSSKPSPPFVTFRAHP